MENPVLESTQFLVENPKFVHIDKARLEEVAKTFSQDKLKIPAWDFPEYIEGNNESTIDFFLLGNSLNFAFTDFETKEKYSTEYNGKEFRGSGGMWASLKRALEDGMPILDGKFLRNISLEEVRKIFEGNMEIPMLNERYLILREVGLILSQKYGGHFHNLVSQSNQRLFNGRYGIVERLVQDFPSFNDTMRYNSHFAQFHKRAQLGPAMLYGRFRNEGAFQVEDIDKLTIFADYVLPQGLREYGILVYEDSLAERVDKEILISAGSREELEIRASTVHACKMLVDRINEYRDEKINSLHIDAKLWSETRKLKDRRPHHLTRTIAY